MTIQTIAVVTHVNQRGASWPIIPTNGVATVPRRASFRNSAAKASIDFWRSSKPNRLPCGLPPPASSLPPGAGGAPLGGCDDEFNVLPLSCPGPPGASPGLPERGGGPCCRQRIARRRAPGLDLMRPREGLGARPTDRGRPGGTTAAPAGGSWPARTDWPWGGRPQSPGTAAKGSPGPPGPPLRPG